MQQYEVRLQAPALDDLQQIYTYIANSSGYEDIAFSFVEKLKEACESLEYTPYRGQNRDYLRLSLRIMPLAKKAVAAFDIDEKANIVRVLAIFYGGQDCDALFTE